MISRWAVRLIKLVVSLLFLPAALLMERLERRRCCTVLYYHEVEKRHRIRFMRQLRALMRFSRPISPLLERSPGAGRRAVALTFDDGYACVFRNAVPALCTQKIPAAFFVPAGLLGGRAAWSGGAEIHGNGRIVDEKILGQLDNELFLVGSHGFSHRRFSSLSPEELVSELRESRKTLEIATGRRVELLSYPFGDYCRSQLPLVESAGFTRAFGILPQPARFGGVLLETGRVEVHPTDLLLEFLLKAAGAYRWLPWAFGMKRRFFRHDG